MKCISATLTRAESFSTSLSRTGEALGSTAIRIGAIRGFYERQERGMKVAFTPLRIGVRLSPVCTPSIRNPYLEIEPEVLWVYADMVQYNDVISNTYWRIK